jgi:hypothetical protein
MEAEFTRLGFMRDISPDAPICRWRYRDLEVDLMPTDPAILGFANRWYPLAVSSAQMVQLPNGIAIRLITAPLFVATKFEAFTDRGKDDPLGSHDMEDIINVIDGRSELPDEIWGRAGGTANLSGRAVRSPARATAFHELPAGPGRPGRSPCGTCHHGRDSTSTHCRTTRPRRGGQADSC